MKYKCDMVKDLMPLYLDQTATKVSEQAVIEHLSECNTCAEYYDMLSREMTVEDDREEPEKKYIILAKRIRRRNTLVRSIIAIFVFACVMLSFNYAVGYRFDPQKAADISGRLNYKSEVIGNHEWNDMNFYIYDSYSCYDVIAVEKTWRGWKVIDTCLSWPKWYEDNVGIEMAGYLYHVSIDKGIQLFPIIVRDDKVKTVEVTIFGETKKIEVTTDELMLITFECSDMSLTNEAKATAYDCFGNSLYELGELKGYWVWEAIK